MRAGLVLMLSLLAVPAGAQDAPAEEPTESEPDEAPGDATTNAAEEPPSELDSHLQAARSARERGDFESALEHSRGAYELAPSAEHLLSVADALGALRRDGELRAAFRAFLAADPEHVRAPEVLARLAVLDAAATAPPPAPPAAEVFEEEEPYEEEEEHDIFDEAWFWAVVAVVAAGGLFAVLYATEQGGVEDPIPGDGGFVIGTIVELP